ncbi:hypothetical protein Agub_g14151 [Astrephomene gubernaculifera]|uniref:K Homology domain-containing protein n=1 Tax=Astrephomene gubernaculifera TaxID=47775 RepID=A0AAD3E591_9CHLO|nr:hypothetical protein Agub_g14151 [Astrephomene gubernaculifera]
MQQQTGSGAGGRRQTAVVTCPKSMVGRVIGRSGETIKALQTYTGALIQIDQTCDPTKIAISGTPQNLNLALSMVHDIVRGTFKGFALLRQATGHCSKGPQQIASRPVYAPGYGLIPPSQLYGSGDAGAMLHAAAAGFLTPRGLPGAAGLAGAAGTYPQLLGGPGALATAPRPLLMGMPPVHLQASPLHAPVYNMMGAPVYFSPLDFSGSSAPHMAAHLSNGGGAPEMVLYTDGTAPLLATAPSAAGGGAGGIMTGSRLFHSVSHSNGGGAANGGGGGGAEATSYGTSAAGGGGPRGVSSGGLVVDTEGALYTYQ